ncbi:hypothetical protein F2P81_017557 [Scophthalmus maximus]|uniref:Uncharacterized protein n=1 Tax=Scophthalmus maximus TaxID=52904 RepID=A0A6A4S6I1_SCOMX|nr:hypothetical protein F2P81_017557 [Scophthalmus maximus]
MIKRGGIDHISLVWAKIPTEFGAFDTLFIGSIGTMTFEYGSGCSAAGFREAPPRIDAGACRWTMEARQPETSRDDDE